MLKDRFRCWIISVMCCFVFYHTYSILPVRCYACIQPFNSTHHSFKVLFVKEVLDMSFFPTLLLFTTIFRISLNVSSTRLILSTGNPGVVVNVFGQFVGGGNLVIGAIVFIVLIIIQFVVINKGSERVAEVTARFTLDAMPGKQMAIDADLNTEPSLTRKPRLAVIKSRRSQASTELWMVLQST